MQVWLGPALASSENYDWTAQAMPPVGPAVSAASNPAVASHAPAVGVAMANMSPRVPVTLAPDRCRRFPRVLSCR